jgi:hypothetical protein
LKLEAGAIRPFRIVVSIATVAAAVVALFRIGDLKLPLVLPPHINVMQYNTRSNPSLRSLVVCVTLNIDGDGIE